MSCTETPCADCHGGCCRAFAVPITGADVIRIEQAGYDFWQFACRWADPDGQIAQRYAPHLHFADEPQTPFVLALMHRASSDFVGTDCCRFLREASDTRADGKSCTGCSIYESRPAACRAFPMKFDPNREIVELHPVYDPEKAAQSDAYKLCPRPWSPEHVDGVSAAQTLAAAEYEATFFKKIVQLWNRKPGDWTAFPNFLRLVYSSRVRAAVVAADSNDRPIVFPINEYRRAETPQEQSKRAAG